MSESSLILNSVFCGYGKKFNMENISCSFNAGQVNGIIGPNGSGKTTILRVATGIIPFTSGSIELNGKDIRSISPTKKAKSLAVVTQELSSLFDMNVLEYVLLGRIPRRKTWFADSKTDIKIAEEMLNICEAAKFATRNMTELSGGERQLVHIARALAQEPSILFLDEPTNHLDLSHQHQIMSLVKNLAHKNKLAIAVVLHDLNLAARFCDKLYLVHNGKIHSSGTPEEILREEILNSVYSAKIAICKDPVDNKPLIFTPL